MIILPFIGRKLNNMSKGAIEHRYRELCAEVSDINEHLPILREYADRCNHVTELGVRGCVSLFAFLSSKASKVVAVDIGNVWTPDVEKLQFICADDLTIELEETDLLFIDTLHNYNHCIQELRLHGNKVRKYIAFHDTGIFGKDGDDGGKGLNFAIREYFDGNPAWRKAYETEKNNGLTIYERI